MKPGPKPKPRETKACEECGATFARRQRCESPERFQTRRFCSLPCSRKGQSRRTPGAVGLTNGHVTIPREPIAGILRRELKFYKKPDIYNPEGDEAEGVGLMAESIARSQGLKQASVVRRISGILKGTIAAKSRDGSGYCPGEVLVKTVDWILDGLALPDAWHVELSDWNRILIAYHAGHLTLAEYREQSALYNLMFKAETNAPPAKSKASVSDRGEFTYARAA